MVSKLLGMRRLRFPARLAGAPPIAYLTVSSAPSGRRLPNDDRRTERSMPRLVRFDDRGVLRVSGADGVSFLQGLTSNDVRRAGPGRALFSALLTPQGKYLHDFCIVAPGDALLLDCEGARRTDLLRRLKMYRLRSKVTLDDVTEAMVVAAVIGDGAAQAFGLPAEPGAATACGDGVACVDPRHAGLGVRLLLPRDTADVSLAGCGLAESDPAEYDRLRLSLGVPDGSRDLAVEKATLLESNYDALHAISWDKGCYMGQELTARTKYRGLVKKRLVPVTVEGPLPDPGTPVLLDGREVGELRTGRDGLALALLRLDALERINGDGGTLAAGEARVVPRDAASAAVP
jgi:hypothetical protein